MANQPTTLYDYYASTGSALPSLSQRAQTFQQLGLGSASTYAGTAAQNTALLSKLTGSTNNAPQQNSNTGNGPTPQPTQTPTATPTSVQPQTVYQQAQTLQTPSFTISAALPNQMPTLTSPAITSTPAQPSYGFSPETQQKPETPQRTFKKIGLDIYETTNGSLQHVTDLSGTGLTSDPNWWNKLQSIDVNTLSEPEKQLVNRIATDTWGQPVAKSSQLTPGSIISGKEIAGTTPSTTGLPRTTQEEYDNNISSQIGPIIHDNIPNQNAFTPSQASNGNNQYYKVWNVDTKNWDIYSIDGTHVTALPDGINVDHINTPSSLKAFANINIGGTTEDDSMPESTYNGPDTELRQRADEIMAQLNELRSRDPFLSQTITDIRKQLNDEIGLSGLYKDRNIIQDKINEITNTYEKLQGEIRENPNLSQQLKARRGQYLDQQQLNILNPLTRNIKSIDARIQQAEKGVTERLGDVVQQYNIYRGQVNDLQDAYDKLEGRIDKEADNARQALNTLITNPELLKGITQAEFEYISRNGTYPASLIGKISTDTGEKLQTIFYSSPSVSTKQAWGVTKDNKVIALGGPVSDVTSTGSGTSRNTSSFQDINGSRYLVTYNDNGTILNKQLIGNATSQSTTELRQQFLNWLPTVKDTYTKDQLSNVVSIFLPGYNSSKDTALKNSIDTYAHKIRFGTDVPKDDTDPIVTFNSFNTGIAGTSPAQPQTYTVTGSDGSVTRQLTPEQVQQAQALGYTVVPQ